MIHSPKSTVQTLKFGNLLISSYSLLDMWLIIYAGIISNQCWWKGSRRFQALYWIITILIDSQNSGLVIWVTACGDYTNMVHYIPTDPSMSHLIILGWYYVRVIHDPTENAKKTSKCCQISRFPGGHFDSCHPAIRIIENSPDTSSKFDDVFGHGLTLTCHRAPMAKCHKNNNPEKNDSISLWSYADTVLMNSHWLRKKYFENVHIHQFGIKWSNLHNILVGRLPTTPTPRVKNNKTF